MQSENTFFDISMEKRCEWNVEVCNCAHIMSSCWGFHFQVPPWHVVIQADDARCAVCFWLLAFIFYYNEIPMLQYSLCVCRHTYMSACLHLQSSRMYKKCVTFVKFFGLSKSQLPSCYHFLSISLKIRLRDSSLVTVSSHPPVPSMPSFADQIYCPFCSSVLTGRDVIKNGLCLSLLISHSFPFSKYDPF